MQMESVGFQPFGVFVCNNGGGAPFVSGLGKYFREVTGNFPSARKIVLFRYTLKAS